MSGLAHEQNIFLFTGDTQSGKTSYLIELVDLLKKRGLSVGGFLAPGSFESGERSGFTLKNIMSGIEIPMASVKITSNWMKYRRFWFNPAAFKLGMEWIHVGLRENPDVLVIDEVGPMELEGGGWHKTLEFLQDSSVPLQLWSVRKQVLEEVRQHWRISSKQVIRIDEIQVERAAELITIR